MKYELGPFGLRETVDCFVALLLGEVFFLGGQGCVFFGGVLGRGEHNVLFGGGVLTKNAGSMLNNRC